MDETNEPTPDVPADEVVEAIKSGLYDGQLVDILEAVRERFAHGTTEQKWKIDYDGETFTQDSLDLAEAATVEELTGQSWAFLNPVNSARECQAIITACLQQRHNMRRADAKAKAGKLKVEEAVAAVGSYEVKRAPKDSAA